MTDDAKARRADEIWRQAETALEALEAVRSTSMDDGRLIHRYDSTPEARHEAFQVAEVALKEARAAIKALRSVALAANEGTDYKGEA